jgi:hypothetical protein
MKKRLALALLVMFSLAVFTPAIASMVDGKATVEMLNDDNKEKKDTKTAEKKDAACDKTEKKACGDKAEAKAADCSKAQKAGCCASKKAEKK